MAFHISNLGAFGGGNALHADMDGYVPQEDDGPWDLAYDHGCQASHADWEDQPSRLREAIDAILAHRQQDDAP